MGRQEQSAMTEHVRVWIRWRLNYGKFIRDKILSLKNSHLINIVKYHNYYSERCNIEQNSYFSGNSSLTVVWETEVEQEGGNQDARGFYGGWRDGGHSRKDVCWVDFNGMTRSEQNFERDYGVRQVDIWQKRF